MFIPSTHNKLHVSSNKIQKYHPAERSLDFAILRPIFRRVDGRNIRRTQLWREGFYLRSKFRHVFVFSTRLSVAVTFRALHTSASIYHSLHVHNSFSRSRVLRLPGHASSDWLLLFHVCFLSRFYFVSSRFRGSEAGTDLRRLSCVASWRAF